MTDDSLSDEDKALFRDHMRSVKPLKQQDRVKEEKVTPALPIRKKRQTLEHRPHQRPPISDYIQDEVHSDTILNWSHSPLPASRFRDFKQGRIRWEARLDLHGLTANEARDKVCDFIIEQTALERRCVLIIHGRGNYNNNTPILKNLIHRWLPQIDQVRAFHSAQAKDGGLGAVYVLLKKGYTQG